MSIHNQVNKVKKKTEIYLEMNKQSSICLWLLLVLLIEFVLQSKLPRVDWWSNCIQAANVFGNILRADVAWRSFLFPPSLMKYVSLTFLILDDKAK